MIGYLAIVLALVATGVALFHFVNAQLAAGGKAADQGLKKGAFWYRTAAGMAAVAGVFLLYIILTDQFGYAYVAAYSSRDLALAYKFSVFWAGQDGSFLLWLLFHVGMGLLLLRGQEKRPGMLTAYSALQAVLLVILLAKSPFMMLTGARPDGGGLNPLLQDPWMVIHPPVVFLGYAGLAVPLAFALDSLWCRRYLDWVRPALPWALFSWSMLGAGIFIGGFWAYKVLGWGGYWGWDPVENASLVPWLVGGALVHCLLLARVRPAAVKPAYVAAIAAFAFILYGTFLTRSGILSDFSTHSFADEGVGGLLAGLLILTLVVTKGALILRWPQLPAGELYPRLCSREFLLLLAALSLAMLAALVTLGMSTPVFTLLLGNAQNVSNAFYNQTSLPVGILIAALLLLAPLFPWKGEKVARGSWLLAAAVSVGALAILAAAGLRSPLPLLAAALAGGGMITATVGLLRGQTSRTAAVAHLGTAAMIVGIMTSSLLGQAEVIHLTQGEQVKVFGYALTYQGLESLPAGKGQEQVFRFEEPAAGTVKALTKFNKSGAPAAREPGIFRQWAEDVYLTPVAHEEDDGETVILPKGEKVRHGELEFSLARFAMAGMGSDIKVQAFVDVTAAGQTVQLVPELGYRGGRLVGSPLKVFDRYEISLTAVQTSTGRVEIGVRDLAAPAKPQHLDVEVSTKPYILLVWIGTALMTAGSLWGSLRRPKI